MKVIPLTQGKFATVDDEDYDELMRYKWYFTKSGPITRMRERRYVAMHQMLLKARSGIDHIDRNNLNNIRSNLRLANQSQNLANASIRYDNKSGYKGVSWHKQTQKWQVHIKVNYESIYLGLFKTKEEAALVYNKAAIKYFGEFANLNVIPDATPIQTTN